MARTVCSWRWGSSRADPHSPTLRALSIGNLVIQLGLPPIDPLAYLSGVFVSLGSFVPNTLLHVVLATAFTYCLRAMGRAEPRRSEA